MAALGAEVVDFPARTACCGGHMTQISPEVAWELLRRIVEPADHAQADLLVTVCPMCQMNVDSYQGEMDRHLGLHYHMPILFFTQLMGLAFGRPPAELGIGTEVVSAARALARIRVEIPPPAEPLAQGGHEPRRQKRPTGLPMPEPLPEQPQPAEVAR